MRAGARLALLTVQIGRLEIKDTRKTPLGRLVHQQYLHPLTLDQTLRVRENSEDHVLNGALLLEDHTRQVKQNLVPFDLQLRLLVEMRIAQSNTAELQVTREYLLILLGKRSVATFVNHLSDPNDIPVDVLNRHAE